MKSNINLNWLRTFEAAARLSGFSAAGRELGLTQVAVSQQIKALETKLGHELFIRQAKKVHLTEAGRAYLQSVREGLEKLSFATYGLFGSDIKQTIVIRGSISVLTWLTPRLQDFRNLYPNINLKLVTSLWPDPIDTQKIDLDIVLSSSSQFTVASEKLSDEFLVPVYGNQSTNHVSGIKDLLALQPIQIVGFDDHWSRYQEHFDLQHDQRQFPQLQVDTSVIAIDLVASGIGVAVVIERFAQQAIEAGKPICIVGDPIPLDQSHFLIKKYSLNEQPVLAEVEALSEWLRRLFKD